MVAAFQSPPAPERSLQRTRTATGLRFVAPMFDLITAGDGWDAPAYGSPPYGIDASPASPMLHYHADFELPDAAPESGVAFVENVPRSPGWTTGIQNITPAPPLNGNPGDENGGIAGALFVWEYRTPWDGTVQWPPDASGDPPAGSPGWQGINPAGHISTPTADLFAATYTAIGPTGGFVVYVDPTNPLRVVVAPYSVSRSFKPSPIVTHVVNFGDGSQMDLGPIIPDRWSGATYAGFADADQRAVFGFAHTYATAGTYTIELIISAYELTTLTTLEVTVTAPPAPPVDPPEDDPTPPPTPDPPVVLDPTSVAIAGAMGRPTAWLSPI